MAQNRDAGVRMPAGYMRVRYAADRLECTARTVLRHIKDGSLRARRIGLRYWAVLRADVEFEASWRAR